LLRSFPGALALVLFGLAHDTPTALVASLLAGAAWIVVLSSLDVSAQVALPEWVRARGLAIFMTVYFGAHAAGSALWGQVAAVWGLPLAHFIAAAGALLAIPIGVGICRPVPTSISRPRCTGPRRDCNGLRASYRMIVRRSAAACRTSLSCVPSALSSRGCNAVTCSGRCRVVTFDPELAAIEKALVAALDRL
jgi:hypothetical protein